MSAFSIAFVVMLLTAIFFSLSSSESATPKVLSTSRLSSRNTESIGEITKEGWDQIAAGAALSECSGNVTSALEFLQEQEERLQQTFYSTLQQMVSAGIDEREARGMLWEDWIQGESGHQNNISTPTLRQQSDDDLSREGEDDHRSKSKDEFNLISRDEVIVHASTADLQSLLADRPVPAIILFHAPWCGPCKALAPVLEQISLSLNGALRLIKIDGDNNQELLRELEVEGFPTFMTVKNGLILDKYVGVPRTEDVLHDMILKLITEDSSNCTKMPELSRKLMEFAGMQKLNVPKIAKFRNLVSAQLHPVSFATDTIQNSNWTSAFVASQYIFNAAQQILNPKFRTISMGNALYRKHIEGQTIGSSLLHIAGYRPNESRQCLELIHRNAAITGIVSQRIQFLLDQIKFSKSNKPN